MKSIRNELPDLSLPVPLDEWNNYFLIPQGPSIFLELCDSQGWINQDVQK